MNDQRTIHYTKLGSSSTLNDHIEHYINVPPLDILGIAVEPYINY